jgi:hypothetical protein
MLRILARLPVRTAVPLFPFQLILSGTARRYNHRRPSRLSPSLVGKGRAMQRETPKQKRWMTPMQIYSRQSTLPRPAVARAR